MLHLLVWCTGLAVLCRIEGRLFRRSCLAVICPVGAGVSLQAYMHPTAAVVPVSMLVGRPVTASK